MILDSNIAENVFLSRTPELIEALSYLSSKDASGSHDPHINAVAAAVHPTQFRRRTQEQLFAAARVHEADRQSHRPALYCENGPGAKQF